MTTQALSAPSSPYGQFDEKGYHFQAYLPAGPDERTAFLVIVSHENQPQLELEVPMLYAPIFGVDAGDAAALEDATNKLVDMLPGGPLTDAQLEPLEQELGARRVVKAQ